MTDAHPLPALDGEDLETWSALATVLEWLPAALDAQLQRDSQLTHFEYGILYALSHAPDRTLRLSVLAGYANSTLSRLSRAATRLEDRGLMRREPDARDGRYTLAILTGPGRDAVERAAPGHAQLVHDLVLDRLTGSQRRQLREISRRITAAVRPEGAWTPPAPPAAATDSLDR
ncbi:MarR family winged helix-turn-helix transcriptional regulator [Microbacterium sp. 179-B 1A2 NHS]|uniref:MarR family winged helix-turn-helix transcriptional regulator n=1 Tax=Microbacterium sp. 179-B 1A2 NHS TaxID=3142383 RepID=UPI0039A2535D